MKLKLILAAVLSAALLTSCEVTVIQDGESSVYKFDDFVTDTDNCEDDDSEDIVKDSEETEEKSDSDEEKSEEENESEDKSDDEDKKSEESDKKEETTSKPDKKPQTDIKEPEAEDKTDNKTQSDEKLTATEKELKKLVDRSIDCLYKLELSTPHTVGEKYGNSYIYQVDTDIFKDYEDFQENFSEIYSKDYMDLVINARDKNDKEQKFFNIDGKLYINYAHAGSKGYYVDWSDYKLEIISETKSECKFRLTAVIEEPADKPVKEPYIKTFRAVYENKEWKLTAPIY